MEPQTLDEFGLPNVVLHEDGNAYYLDSGTKIGESTDPLMFAWNPEGKRIRLSRSKTYGACFRAPWKTGVDYVNLSMIGCSKYYATIDGRIFGTRNMTYLSPRISHDGYELVHLFNDKGDYQPWRVSRIIATAFIENPEHKDTVDHIDGNRRNNHASNLRWMWMFENDDQRRFKHGIPTEKIREICRYLESGMGQTEAAKRAGVGRHVVKDLQYGSYYRITKDYNIPRYANQKRAPVTLALDTQHGQHRRTHEIIDSSPTTNF